MACRGKGNLRRAKGAEQFFTLHLRVLVRSVRGSTLRCFYLPQAAGAEAFPMQVLEEVPTSPTSGADARVIVRSRSDARFTLGRLELV